MNNIDLAHVTKRLSQFRREADNVIFTNRYDLHRESVLIIIGVVVDVVGYQFLSGNITTGDYSLEKLHYFTGIPPVTIEEIESLCKI